MEIYILEDNLVHQGYIETVIKEILTSNKMRNTSVETYSNPEKLRLSLIQTSTTQLFFLDIKIGENEYEGFETAQFIKRRNPYAHIVFVSSHRDYMPLTFSFHVEPLDFINKSLKTHDFQQKIEQAISYTEKMSRQTNKDDFVIPSISYKVPIDRILYFETSSEREHQVILYLENGRLSFRSSLSDLEKISNKLIRCHRSYLINPEKIVHIDTKRRSILLENGHECLVSRLKMNLVKRTFNKLQNKE